MDAITLLKDDHRTVEKLFRRFEKAGENAHAEKREIADRIVEELSIHAAIEEQVFYPVTRMTVEDVEDVVLESLEEHHIVKWVLAEISDMDPRDERFDAKVTVLIENVRHHVKEEESEFFPKVRSELGRKSLADLGDALAKAKKLAPTHPHPRSPDTPPGNLIVGTAAGVVDKVTDTVSGIAQGGVSVVQELVANIRGQKPEPRAATGTRTARKTSTRVRSAAGPAQAAAKRASRSARASAKTTTRRAKSTARKATRPAAKKTTARKATRPAAKKTTPRKATRPAQTAARKTTRPAKKKAATR